MDVGELYIYIYIYIYNSPTYIYIWSVCTLWFQLLHFYLVHLIEDLLAEEISSRCRFLVLRCLYIGRKYAGFIDLPRLKAEVNEKGLGFRV